MRKIQISPQSVNPKAFEVCRILSEAGYQAFIVGGCVRDILLGQIPKDWDITTDATPQKVMELFPKTYPTGLQHGTVTVSMGEGVKDHFEVTTFRIEGEYFDGRRPEQVFFVMHIEQDLARRDLTINAMAYDPIAHRLEDPFSGFEDLQNGIIRAVGKADARFREDGLRIMRVARFAARFGYKVDPETLDGMRRNIETLKKVSMERIRDELCKTLMTKNPFVGFQILQEANALFVACPILEIPYCRHFLPAINGCQGELETRIAFLYCNVATEVAKKELLNLKFSSKEMQRITFLLSLLDVFSKDNKQSAFKSISSYKSFMALVKNHSPDPWEHTLEQFIQLTEAIGYPTRHMFSEYVNIVVPSKKELQINGNDLLEMGVEKGPKIKEFLDKCYLEILRSPENNIKEFLIEFCKSK